MRILVVAVAALFQFSLSQEISDKERDQIIKDVQEKMNSAKLVYLNDKDSPKCKNEKKLMFTCPKDESELITITVSRAKEDDKLLKDCNIGLFALWCPKEHVYFIYTRGVACGVLKTFYGPFELSDKKQNEKLKWVDLSKDKFDEAWKKATGLAKKEKKFLIFVKDADDSLIKDFEAKLVKELDKKSVNKNFVLARHGSQGSKNTLFVYDSAKGEKLCEAAGHGGDGWTKKGSIAFPKELVTLMVELKPFEWIDADYEFDGNYTKTKEWSKIVGRAKKENKYILIAENYSVRGPDEMNKLKALLAKSRDIVEKKFILTTFGSYNHGHQLHIYDPSTGKAIADKLEKFLQSLDLTWDIVCGKKITKHEATSYEYQKTVKIKGKVTYVC